MPEDAPVTRAAPLEISPAIVCLPFALAPWKAERAVSHMRSGVRLKCHIYAFLGHHGFEPMQTIGFVVFPGFQVMGFAAVAAFEVANLVAGEDIYRVRLLSDGGGLVAASAGFSVDTEALASAEFDTVIVGAGIEIE